MQMFIFDVSVSYHFDIVLWPSGINWVCKAHCFKEATRRKQKKKKHIQNGFQFHLCRFTSFSLLLCVVVFSLLFFARASTQSVHVNMSSFVLFSAVSSSSSLLLSMNFNITWCISRTKRKSRMKEMKRKINENENIKHRLTAIWATLLLYVHLFVYLFVAVIEPVWSYHIYYGSIDIMFMFIAKTNFRIDEYFLLDNEAKSSAFVWLYSCHELS